MIIFDTHELSALAVDLGKVSAGTTVKMAEVFREAGRDLTKQWAANARATSGTHGKYYPDSIDSEMQISTDIVVEVGPNPAKKQGGMSFEYGSVNQPPHLDGQKAADAEVPKLEARVDTALAYLLRGL